MFKFICIQTIHTYVYTRKYIYIMYMYTRIYMKGKIDTDAIESCPLVARWFVCIYISTSVCSVHDIHSNIFRSTVAVICGATAITSDATEARLDSQKLSFTLLN